MWFAKNMTNQHHWNGEMGQSVSGSVGNAKQKIKDTRMQNKNDKCEQDVKREILYIAIYQAAANGKLKVKSDKSIFEDTCNRVLPQDQNSPVL